MISQVMLGHAWLQQVFNTTPTIAWQIDPFGWFFISVAVLGD
jgi:Glycosyl hydrolases family 38 N-terminal domain